MNLPKGYLPREGDVLTVRGKVNYDIEASDGNVHLSFEGDPRRFVIPLAAVDGIHSLHWKVGDKVRDGGATGDVGEVRAVEGDCVWVRLTSGAFGTYEANDLEPAPDEPTVKEPPTHPNGAPMFAPDGTMLDDQGNRSVFDDVDATDTDGDDYADRAEWKARL
jgi:hypothetical protein